MNIHRLRLYDEHRSTFNEYKQVGELARALLSFKGPYSSKNSSFSHYLCHLKQSTNDCGVNRAGRFEHFTARVLWQGKQVNDSIYIWRQTARVTRRHVRHIA